ncbi:uncharacterized protein LOC121734194 [Aricia agestis]|uniref:uncharacterized protein LOC121734194 n=1 Tax=Aricia agestis TaxID=91739 RepID=UPI001C206CA6|nr:uncharacterized protein LOC121734194 [Aricia agestis]
MNDNSVFIFGSISSNFDTRDAVSLLPLELCWKIFSYLDKHSLSNACKTCKLWRRIILSKTELRSRLNDFDLALRVGCERRATFYKNNRKVLKKLKRKNYLPMAKCTVESTQKTTCKRGGDDFVIHTKRYRLF